ncbi:MAG: CPBP family intramembrane metalloprotease [Bacteroidetes bacterium]|nr:CPBP family intramembrane metalloprotease [Bacteroidota bacterium]MCL2303356.1 CPBP family intramembrane metalloprotease [Lentimicrobiaceae bacterium]
MPPLFANKSYWLQFCYLLLFIAGGVIIFGALALLVSQLSGIAVGSRWHLYVTQSISSFGVFFAPALLFSYCASKRWFSYSEADQIAAPPLVGYVLILSLFILPVIACLGYLNEQITLPESMQNIEIWMRKMEEASKVALHTLTANSNIPILLLNIMVMAIFPAIFEEFLFRGAIQPLFTKWFNNKHVAIIVTAFIFSAIHFQFYGFIPRFLLGIYLGYLLIWGKSLWLPIIAHFMHNAVSLILDYGAQRRGIDLETVDPSQIREFYPVVLFSTFCVTLCIYYLWKKSKKINV